MRKSCGTKGTSSDPANEAERASQRLRALAEITRAFAATTTDYDALLEVIVERTTHFIGDGCLISLVSEDGRWVRPAAVWSRDERATVAMRAAFVTNPLDADRTSLTARVLRTGEPVLVSHVDAQQIRHLVAAQYVGAAEHIGVHSLLSVPLRAHGRAIGALTLARCNVGAPPYDEDDVELARSIGDHAALAISNAYLLETLHRELRERRRAQDEAEAFVAFAENSQDFIAMAGFNGDVLFVNAAGRRLVGIEQDFDVRKLTLTDFHTDDGLSRTQVLQAHGSWQGEGVLRHFKTRALIPTHVSSFVARGANGEPLCFATVQRDMRETKRLAAQLQQTQKMDVVGRLAGGVAHDFNNLLSVILSYSSMVSDTLAEGDASRADLEEIMIATRRAAALTEQLLTLSRQHVPAPVVLDLNTVVDGMYKIARRLVSETVEIRIECASDLDRVKVDEAQMEQVVLNLVVNARDAMPDGGVLRLETKNVVVASGSDPTESDLAPGAYVMLSVADTGIGMDAATKERIFEPFFTTKEKGKGTGLGLAMVFDIVAQNGGQIRVHSEPGRGATFRVYFPCVADTRVPSVLPLTSSMLPPRGSERILLVEDEGQVRTVMRNILQRAGYEVIESPDPEDALLANERSTGPIDMLLTDLVMPKMSGRALAEHFLRRRPAAKVLYVSGYGEDMIESHGMLDPGVAFLQKPITPGVLLRRTRDVLDS